jgi:hypothetical protein
VCVSYSFYCCWLQIGFVLSPMPGVRGYRRWPQIGFVLPPMLGRAAGDPPEIVFKRTKIYLTILDAYFIIVIK